MTFMINVYLSIELDSLYNTNSKHSLRIKFLENIFEDNDVFVLSLLLFLFSCFFWVESVFMTSQSVELMKI